MLEVIKRAKEEVAKKAAQDFEKKILDSNGFIPNYEGRPPIKEGLPWIGLVKKSADYETRAEQTGIGIVISVIRLSTNLAIVYTDITGDHVIDHLYLTEL